MAAARFDIEPGGFCDKGSCRFILKRKNIINRRFAAMVSKQWILNLHYATFQMCCIHTCRVFLLVAEGLVLVRSDIYDSRAFLCHFSFSDDLLLNVFYACIKRCRFCFTENSSAEYIFDWGEAWFKCYATKLSGLTNATAVSWWIKAKGKKTIVIAELGGKWVQKFYVNSQIISVAVRRLR